MPRRPKILGQVPADGFLNSGEPLALRDEISDLARRRLLEAARDLFYERGYQGTTLDAVAERLNVTKTLIYTHFKNKEELLTQISRIGTEKSAEAADLAARHDGSALERLTLLIDHFVRSVIQYQRNVAVFFREEKNLSEAARQEIFDLQKRFDDNLSEILEAGVKSREFSIPDIRLTTLAIAGVGSWIYAWYRPYGRLSEDQLVSGITELVLRMVGAEGSGAATKSEKAAKAAKSAATQDGAKAVPAKAASARNGTGKNGAGKSARISVKA